MQRDNCSVYQALHFDIDNTETGSVYIFIGGTFSHEHQVGKFILKLG